MPTAIVFGKTRSSLESLPGSCVNWLHQHIDVGIAHDANGRQQISSKQSQPATSLPNGAKQRSADAPSRDCSARSDCQARHWTSQATHDGDGEKGCIRRAAGSGPTCALHEHADGPKWNLSGGWLIGR